MIRKSSVTTINEAVNTLIIHGQERDCENEMNYIKPFFHMYRKEFGDRIILIFHYLYSKCLLQTNASMVLTFDQIFQI